MVGKTSHNGMITLFLPSSSQRVSVENRVTRGRPGRCRCRAASTRREAGVRHHLPFGRPAISRFPELAVIVCMPGSTGMGVGVPPLTGYSVAAGPGSASVMTLSGPYQVSPVNSVALGGLQLHLRERDLRIRPLLPGDRAEGQLAVVDDERHADPVGRDPQRGERHAQVLDPVGHHVDGNGGHWPSGCLRARRGAEHDDLGAESTPTGRRWRPSSSPRTRRPAWPGGRRRGRCTACCRAARPGTCRPARPRPACNRCRSAPAGPACRSCPGGSSGTPRCRRSSTPRLAPVAGFFVLCCCAAPGCPGCRGDTTACRSARPRPTAPPARLTRPARRRTASRAAATRPAA